MSASSVSVRRPVNPLLFELVALQTKQEAWKRRTVQLLQSFFLLSGLAAACIPVLLVMAIASNPWLPVVALLGGIVLDLVPFTMARIYGRRIQRLRAQLH